MNKTKLLRVLLICIATCQVGLAQQGTRDSLLNVREHLYTFAKNGMRDSVRLYSTGALESAVEFGDPKLITDFTYLHGVGFQLKNRGKALDLYRKTFRLASSHKYHKMIAYSALKIGGINRILGQYDTANFYFDITKNAIDQTESADFRLLARYHGNLARYYEAIGGFEKATRNYMEALKICEKNNLPTAALHYEFGLAKIHYRLEDFQKSAEFSNSALIKAKESGNNGMIASSLQVLGLIAAREDMPDSALHIFMNLKKYFHHSDSMQLSKLYIMIATAHEELNQWDSAYAYLVKSRLLTRDQDYITKANWNLIYSDLKLEYKQLDSAVHYAYESLYYANLLQNTTVQSEVYGALVVLHALEGKTDSIKSYHEKSIALYKSSLNDRKVLIIEDLRVSYETAKNEKEIADLKSQNEIQALINRQRTLIWIGVIIAVLFLVAVIILSYQKKLFRQKHQVSIHKQQLLRSQINPHFIFNALTSIRGYLFDGNDIRLSVNYLGKFAKLMRMVLDHSSKEWVPLEEELDALSLYLEIQKMRFKDSFDYELVIDRSMETDQIMIPPLLAQPFIENAVEHGFKNIDYTGKLDLSCKVEGETIRFEIIDNGIGIDHIADKKKHESKAHNIFKERVRVLSKLRKTRLYYLIEDLGKYAGKRGTKVEYTIPIEWNYA